MEHQLEQHLHQLEVALAYAGQMALKTYERGQAPQQQHLLLALHALQQKGQQ